jgi:hypothetical protein
MADSDVETPPYAATSNSNVRRMRVLATNVETPTTHLMSVAEEGFERPALGSS